MFDNVVQDVRAHVEGVVSAKMGELEGRLSMLLSVCAKEASVRDGSDALKVLLAGVEMRFREEHTALVEAINAHTEATNAQTALLEAVCGDVKVMSEKVDVLCSHTGRLGNIEGDVAAIAGSVQGIANGMDAVSSFISGLNGHLDDIQLVVGHKANEIRKAEDEKRLAELKVQEERRKAEEARQKEEQEREAKRKVEEAMRSSFSGKDSEVMAKGVNALKQWTGKARATIIYDSKKDPFTFNGLFEKVRDKPNIAVVGFTTDGDVFGGFYSVAVTGQGKGFYDPNMFVFSFESHGRCTTPQRFVVKERLKEDAYVYFCKNSSGGFVDFWVTGEGGFFLGNEKSNSYCWNMSDAFEGLEDTTLTGQNNTNWRNPPYHHCARLVAIQLE